MPKLVDLVLGPFLVRYEALDELVMLLRQVPLNLLSRRLDEVTGVLQGQHLHVLQLRVVDSLLQPQLLCDQIANLALEFRGRVGSELGVVHRANR